MPKISSMSFEVKTTEYFERRSKRLFKKYKSLPGELYKIINQLIDHPHLGTAIGKGCYKIRIAISSKGKGKSGGARLITYVWVVENSVFLIDIYDKSEQENIIPQELQNLIKNLSS